MLGVVAVVGDVGRLLRQLVVVLVGLWLVGRQLIVVFARDVVVAIVVVVRVVVVVGGRLGHVAERLGHVVVRFGEFAKLGVDHARLPGRRSVAPILRQVCAVVGVGS